MEENNKYYTPRIEDITIGYECEIYEQSTNKLIKSVNWHIVSVVLGNSEYGETVAINKITNYLKQNKIRVPYLTKENIESEGWVFRGSICSDSSCKGWELSFIKDGMKYNFSFTQNYQAHIYTWDSTEGTHTIFRGVIKSINEFRYITKELLDIK